MMTPQPPPPVAIQPTSTSSSATTAAEVSPSPPSSSTEDPDDECVLWCYPLQQNPQNYRYKECCGKVICMGCIIAQQCTLIIGTNVKKPIQGSWEEELEFRKIFASEQIMVCPFCRAQEPTTSMAHLKRLWK